MREYERKRERNRGREGGTEGEREGGVRIGSDAECVCGCGRCATTMCVVEEAMGKISRFVSKLPSPSSPSPRLAGTPTVGGIASSLYCAPL